MSFLSDKTSQQKTVSQFFINRFLIFETLLILLSIVPSKINFKGFFLLIILRYFISQVREYQNRLLIISLNSLEKYFRSNPSTSVFIIGLPGYAFYPGVEEILLKVSNIGFYQWLPDFFNRSYIFQSYVYYVPILHVNVQSYKFIWSSCHEMRLCKAVYVSNRYSSISPILNGSQIIF